MPIAPPRGAALASVALVDISRDRDRLAFRFSLDGSPFATSIWYDGLDLLALESRYGYEAMQRLYVHIAAFAANQYASLAPDTIDFGAYARYVDEPFVALWTTVFRGIWAQWRYENARATYDGPKFEIARTEEARPIERDVAPSVLLFSGGGKDGVVCQSLLGDAAIPFGTFACAHSIYGSPARQHRLIDDVVVRSRATSQHRAWIFDEFMESPILSLRPRYDVRTLLAAETPFMIFASLPVVLAGGFSSIVLGHERSADFGNFTWRETGEEINHTWGKSLEAERAIGAYIAQRLLAGVSLCSIIKPLSDVAILSLAARELETMRYAHSCSIAKPWCRRCTKCAYVWLSYRAYFPQAFVDDVFGSENLFDVPELRAIFRGIVGIAEHKPFDCIGLPDEALLAFELCRRKGLRGAAISDFERYAPTRDYAALATSFLEIDDSRTSNIPAALWAKIEPDLHRVLAREAEQMLAALRA